jgi:hypothetical protein
MSTLADIQAAVVAQGVQLDAVVAKVAALKTVVPVDQPALDAVAAAVTANDGKIAAALA